jgi:hypothetical protein
MEFVRTNPKGMLSQPGVPVGTMSRDDIRLVTSSIDVASFTAFSDSMRFCLSSSRLNCGVPLLDAELEDFGS